MIQKVIQTILAAIVVFTGVTMISCANNNGANNLPDPSSKPEPEDLNREPKELNYLFESGNKGYYCFRIPAIVKATIGYNILNMN